MRKPAHNISQELGELTDKKIYTQFLYNSLLHQIRKDYPTAV
jgi:hypothetical protein